MVNTILGEPIAVWLAAGYDLDTVVRQVHDGWNPDEHDTERIRLGWRVWRLERDLVEVRQQHDNLIEQLAALISEDEMDDAAIEIVIVEWVKRQVGRADKLAELAANAIDIVDSACAFGRVDTYKYEADWARVNEALPALRARLAELRG